MTRQERLRMVGIGAVVLAILIGMGISGAKKQVSVQETQTRLGLLRTAIEQYQLEMGQPPETLGDLAASRPEVRPSPFLEDPAVTNDAWGSPFSYTIKSTTVTDRDRVVKTTRDHVLVSLGPDKADAAKDNVTLQWQAD